MSAPRTPRVVVIGAGFGGLSAAAALASHGCAVHVVERADAVGGKAGTASVDGAVFDTGPSLLTLPEVPRHLFALAGESLDDHVTLRRLDHGFRYHFPSGTQLDVHARLTDTLSSVRAAFGSDAAAELTGFVGYAERIWQASAPEFVFGDAPSLRRVLTLPVGRVAGLARIDALRSMRAAIWSKVRTPELRHVLLRYATYNGSDPRVAPATLNCIAAVELAMGGWGVQGGMVALAAGLAALATRRGATIETGVEVAALSARGKRLTGVRLASGETLAADAVVSNADVRLLHERLLPPRLRPRPTPHTPSMSGYNAVLRVDRRADAVAHQVVFGANYEDEFAAIFDRGDVTPEPTVYACNQRVAHGRPGWDDADALFTMINAPSTRAQRCPLDVDALRDTVLGQLRRAGVAAEAEIVWQRTPAGLAERFPGSDGALYGDASNSRLTAFQRPGNRSPHADGLFVASGTAHPGGGVPLAMLSGLAAARACSAYLGRSYDSVRPMASRST